MREKEATKVEGKECAESEDTSLLSLYTIILYFHSEEWIVSLLQFCGVTITHKFGTIEKRKVSAFQRCAGIYVLRSVSPPFFCFSIAIS